MSVFHVPVDKLVLHSELFEGDVELAGEYVPADQPAHLVVVPVLLGSDGPKENEKQYPDMLMVSNGSLWALEHAKSCKNRGMVPHDCLYCLIAPYLSHIVS